MLTDEQYDEILARCLILTVGRHCFKHSPATWHSFLKILSRKAHIALSLIQPVAVSELLWTYLLIMSVTLTGRDEQLYILGVWHVELKKSINIDISVITLLFLATDVFGEPHRQICQFVHQGSLLRIHLACLQHLTLTAFWLTASELEFLNVQLSVTRNSKTSWIYVKILYCTLYSVLTQKKTKSHLVNTKSDLLRKTRLANTQLEDTVNPREDPVLYPVQCTDTKENQVTPDEHNVFQF